MIRVFLNWLSMVREFKARIVELTSQNDDLERRLRFAEEQRDRYKRELDEKSLEFRAIFDALLMEAGRDPMYSVPPERQSKIKPNPREEQMARLKHNIGAREWSNIASALDAKVEAMANGGINE